MEFINDLSTDSVFELIKQYYRSERGKEIQIGSDEFSMAAMLAYVCGVLVQKFNTQAKQRYLATATGEYLNALGETFDIERPKPTHAVCQVNVTALSGRSYDISVPAGTFFISDNNGVKFTNLAEISLARASTSQTVTFIGVEDKANVLAENNIDLGTITTILTPVIGIKSVSNTTVPVGAVDTFPDTDEGDDAYRHYIIQKRSGVSTGGPAPAYEMRAKETNAEVLDAYCTRHDDSVFAEGVAKIYVLLNPELPTTSKTAIKNAIVAHLNEPDWKPVCDTVSIIDPPKVGYEIGVFVGLRSKYAISGKVKVQQDIDAYVEQLNTKLGQCFSVSELARLCQTADANGVCSEYIRCDDSADNYVHVEKWQHGNFTVEVLGYEIIAD